MRCHTNIGGSPTYIQLVLAAASSRLLRFCDTKDSANVCEPREAKNDRLGSREPCRQIAPRGFFFSFFYFLGKRAPPSKCAASERAAPRTSHLGKDHQGAHRQHPAHAVRPPVCNTKEPFCPSGSAKIHCKKKPFKCQACWYALHNQKRWIFPRGRGVPMQPASQPASQPDTLARHGLFLISNIERDPRGVCLVLNLIPCSCLRCFDPPGLSRARQL